MDAAAGKASLIKVVDPAPRQIPAPDAVKRALDLLKGARKPLILLGKGAAYARADADIRAEYVRTRQRIGSRPFAMASNETHPVYCCLDGEALAGVAAAVGSLLMASRTMPGVSTCGSNRGSFSPGT